MGYESCRDTYSHYFSTELKAIFKLGNKSVPFILEVLEENCNDIDCKHHVFNVAREFGSRNRGEIITEDTPWTLECHRCMCLLDLISDDLSFNDIAKSFGLSREAISYYDKMGLGKLRGMFKNEEDFETKGGDVNAVVRWEV
jgi:hypothetical protein